MCADHPPKIPCLICANQAGARRWVALHTEGELAADEYACDDARGTKLRRNAELEYVGRVSRRSSSDGGGSEPSPHQRSLRSGDMLPTVASGIELGDAAKP